MTAQEFVGLLSGVTGRAPNWTAKCPAHDDGRASLAVSEAVNGGTALFCHAGCNTRDVVAKLGRTMADLMPRNRNGTGAETGIAAIYPYREANGKLLYQALRYTPKGFKQRRPDGAGGWSWSLQGVKRVLYRLPELASADPRQPVFIVEGEKDAERLAALGLVSTTSAGGAGKWRPEYSESLRGRHVFVVPDNDPPGRAHAEEVARSLHGVAASVRPLELPGLPLKGDVSDWLEAGGTLEELKRIARASVAWTPAPPAPEIVEAEERETEVATDLPSFPEEAWSPEPLKVWRDVVAPSTEAPLPFLWASFIAAVGLAIGRQRSIRNPLPLFPNFYVLLVGRTGDSKKSTTLRLLRELLVALGVKVEVLSGVVSSEGIYERLSAENHPTGVPALVFVDEFAALANAARRKGTSDLFPKLNSLYYCPNEDTLDRRKDPTRIVRPFVSVIAAAPAGQLADLVSGSDVSSGTLNRYLVVSGEEQAPKPRPRALDSTDFERVASSLRAILAAASRDSLELTWGDPEADGLYEGFYKSWKSARRAGNASELTSRTPEHALKLAMFYAILRSERVLSPEAVAIGVRLAGWAEASALSLLGDVGLGRHGRAEEWILSALRGSGGRQRKRDLQQGIPKALREDFGRAVGELVRADRLDEATETEISGNKTLWLELKPTPNIHLSVNKSTSVLGVGPRVDHFAVSREILERIAGSPNGLSAEEEPPKRVLL